MTPKDLDLRDRIAAVLDEYRLKPPRVQAGKVVELVNGRSLPAVPVSGCARCASWDAAVTDSSIREQAIEVAVSLGREVPMMRWLFSEIDRAAAGRKRAS